MSELKPCPFCGGPASIRRGGFGERYPQCKDARCGGRFDTGIWATDEYQHLVVHKWNTRPPAVPVEALRRVATAALKARNDGGTWREVALTYAAQINKLLGDVEGDPQQFQIERAIDMEHDQARGGGDG